MEFILVKLQVYIVQTVALWYTDFTTYTFEHVPEISCLEKNILRKRSMVYQRLNKVGILPKRELTLNLVEEVLKILMYSQENLLDRSFFR